jgi:exosome complex RNA-binding protein Csl4
MLKGIIEFRVSAARCNNCDELYMYDDNKNNSCPRCGSTDRRLVR